MFAQHNRFESDGTRIFYAPVSEDRKAQKNVCGRRKPQRCIYLEPHFHTYIAKFCTTFPGTFWRTNVYVLTFGMLALFDGLERLTQTHALLRRQRIPADRWCKAQTWA